MVLNMRNYLKKNLLLNLEMMKTKSEEEDEEAPEVQEHKNHQKMMRKKNSLY